IVVSGRFFKISKCGLHILLYAKAVHIGYACVILCRWVIHISRCLQERHTFGTVCGSASSVEIAQAEIIDSNHKTLLGRSGIELKSLVEVSLSVHHSVFVIYAHIVLGFGVSVIGGAFHPMYSLLEIVLFQITHRQLELCRYQAFICQYHKAVCALCRNGKNGKERKEK